MCLYFTNQKNDIVHLDDLINRRSYANDKGNQGKFITAPIIDIDTKMDHIKNVNTNHHRLYFDMI